MYRAVTDGVQVTVEPRYIEEESLPDEARWFWAYEVEIVNTRAEPVQLLSRYWRITDGFGRVEEVRGPGVVGEQPRIEPGATYRYTSGCPLRTDSGIMAGSYRMVSDRGHSFDVEIPAFSLDTPEARLRLN